MVHCVGVSVKCHTEAKGPQPLPGVHSRIRRCTYNLLINSAQTIFARPRVHLPTASLATPVGPIS